MPELPEVELYRRYFMSHGLGRTIRSVTVSDRGVLPPGLPVAIFRTALEGKRFESVRRHGKNLFAEISDDGFLRMHFGMTGELASFRDAADAPRFARVIFHFADGSHLAYDDPRKFGRLELVRDPEDYLRSRGLGPDPLSGDFQLRPFVRALAKRRRGAVKPLLMNQRVVAGVGNLYADEALFQAGIHPLARVEKLGEQNLMRVFRTLRAVLARVIELQANESLYPRRYLLPRRSEGERCRRCGGRIEKATVGGRTTYFCPRHQRRYSRASG